jgi:hypothetical protein
MGSSGTTGRTEREKTSETERERKRRVDVPHLTQRRQVL